MEIQQEEQRLLGPQNTESTIIINTTDGPDDYENVPMDLTIPVEKPDYYEDKESYSYGSSISVKEIAEDVLTSGTHDYLEQKQA